MLACSQSAMCLFLMPQDILSIGESCHAFSTGKSNTLSHPRSPISRWGGFLMCFLMVTQSNRIRCAETASVAMVSSSPFCYQRIWLLRMLSLMSLEFVLNFNVYYILAYGYSNGFAWSSRLFCRANASGHSPCLLCRIHNVCKGMSCGRVAVWTPRPPARGNVHSQNASENPLQYHDQLHNADKRILRSLIKVFRYNISLYINTVNLEVIPFFWINKPSLFCWFFFGLDLKSWVSTVASFGGRPRRTPWPWDWVELFCQSLKDKGYQVVQKKWNVELFHIYSTLGKKKIFTHSLLFVSSESSSSSSSSGSELPPKWSLE